VRIPNRQASKSATEDLHATAEKIVEAMGILIPALSRLDVEASPALSTSVKRIST
jgi:hypothetical protein